MNAGGPGLPRGAIGCLALTAFGSGLSMRVNDALLPELSREFGVPLGTASQVIALFAIAYGVAQLFFGPLGDRHGKYRVIRWAASACALTALACALAPDFDMLRLARVAAGATVWGYAVLGQDRDLKAAGAQRVITDMAELHQLTFT